MKNILSISKYIYLTYGLLFLLILILILPKIAVSIKDDSNSNAYKKIEVIDKCMFLPNKGDKNINIRLPHSSKDIQKNKEFDLLLDLRDINDLPNKSIGIMIKFADFSISAVGNIFFEFKNPNNYIPKSGGGYGYYIIDLPKDIKSKSIVLHITPNMKNSIGYRLNKIDIGYRNSFFIDMLVHDLGGIIFSFVNIIIFIFTFIMAYIGRKNDYIFKKLINTGLASLTFSLHFLSRYKTITYIFTEYRNIIYFIQYFTFVLILYSILKIIRDVVIPKYEQLLIIVQNSIIFIYIIRLALTLLKIVEFKELYQIDNVLLIIVSILVIGSFSFVQDVSYENKKSILITFSLLILVIFICIYNYVLLSLVSLKLNSALAMLIFLIYQIYESINVYRKIIKENTEIYIYENLLLLDSLTSLGSRYAYENRLKQISEKRLTATIITVDVNNLKNINDELGHAKGDLAIKSVGNYLKLKIQDSDVYRIGGDEFIVIFVGKIKEEFFDNLSRILFVEGISEKMDVSFSLGFSYYIPQQYSNLEESLKISDDNMYKEKNSSKNNNAVRR